MKRFVAGAAGTLMVASVLMAGAGNASASARKPAPKPVVSVSHFAGDTLTLTLSAVAGPRNTIKVKVKFDVTAGQARDPWVLGALRSEDSLGSQVCGCGLFGSTAASWTSPPLVFKGKKAMRTFQETDVMERIMKSDGLSATNGFHVSVTNTKTGVSSGWVDINSVPVR